MAHHAKHPVQIVAAAAAFAVFAQPLAPFVASARLLAQSATAASRAPAAAASVQPPIDGGWPRTYNVPSGGTIVVSQPQVASWVDQAYLIAYSAVAYHTGAADTKPAFGTIKLEAETRVSVADRLVNFKQLKIAETHFQTLQN